MHIYNCSQSGTNDVVSMRLVLKRDGNPARGYQEFCPMEGQGDLVTQLQIACVEEEDRRLLGSHATDVRS
jgi:hypothetical protein